MIVGEVYITQLRAMVVRNIALKYRERRKLIWEICLPLYSFVVLAVMKGLIPNPNYPAVMEPSFSAVVFDNNSLNLNYTIAVVPNTTEVQKFMNHVNKTWNSIRQNVNNGLVFMMFDSKEELQKTYWDEPTSVPFAIIFNTRDPVRDSVLEYEIRTNPFFAAAPENGNPYADRIMCRENSHVVAKALARKQVIHAEFCPAYEYVSSGFVNLQTLLDYTKISIMSNITLSTPNIRLQIFPKEAFTADWMLLFRIVIPAYLVMSLSQFVTYLLMLIVSEKESKIKETLKIAGLRDSVFWLSWFFVYAIFVMILALVATVSIFQLRVFRHSNFFLILLLILLYGFSLIFFSFMLTPFLNHSRSAGIIGNFLINILSLLYFVRIFFVKIDVRLLGFMSLLSPPAFTLALDKALTLDMSGRGIGFHNLWSGPGLSFGTSLMMLFFDNLLYAVLAYYLDLVIPGEYGAKQKPLFFVKPIVRTWRCIFQPGANVKAKRYATADIIDNNIEPVSNNLKNKVGIEIVGLHKHFSQYCLAAAVSAINGINLTIYEGQITAILGHNGAGKTTLFNVLTGMTVPTAGTAYVFGHDIREREEMHTKHRMFGVCPQHNILFDNLSPREHLKLFGAIRGISLDEQDDEVVRVLKDIDMFDQADVYTKFLSGGQKRKLSVGLAVIGSPKVLIFDEPTAGIDPHSRRSVWSILQKYKAGKVILLTTHFMDEADVLADRKAVISKGQLRCVGSSLFLKNKFGVGYHLTFVLETTDLSSDVYRMVQRHVPEVELAREHGKELSLILPHHSVTKFASLFNELETEIHGNGNPLRISSYGISMTTLEEVFLYLEKSEELEDQEGSSLGNRLLKRRIEGRESSSLRRRRISTNSISREFHLSEDAVSSGSNDVPLEPRGVSGVELEAVKLCPNTGEIVKTLLKLRFLSLLRETSRLITLALFPLLLSFIGLHWLRQGIPEIMIKSLTLNQSIYSNGSVIVQNLAETNLLDYFDPAVNLRIENTPKYIKMKPNIGAIKISQCCDDIDLFIAYNDTTIHSLPIMLNIFNNALYRKLTDSESNDTGEFEERQIIAKSFPFVVKSVSMVFDSSLAVVAMCLGLQFIVIPVVFATDFVFDRQIKAKNLLRVNGLSFWMYYSTYLFMMVVTMLVLLSLHLLVISFADLMWFQQPIAFAMLAFLLYLHTPCSLLFTTALSYFFETAETTQSVLLNLTTFIGLIPFWLVLLVDMMKLPVIYMFVVHALFSMFDAFYLPFAILYFVGRVHLVCLSNESCTYVTLKDYFSPEILIIMTSCCLQIPIFLLLLQWLEYWKFGKSGNQIRNTNQTLANTSVEDEQENDDVKFEKYRVSGFMSSTADSPDLPVIVLQNMKKTYYSNSDKNCSNLICRSTCKNDKQQRSRTKEALTGLTFAVGPGEIFGLLGHNGAGKSTAMKIITAEQLPDGGNIQLRGHNLLAENFKRIFDQIGYCPQDDVLFKNITIREHIELYATIRGVPPDKVIEITNSYLSALQIHEHADKLTVQCSGGTKRKLSFAIAMIGNPSIVLMDEPSAGMDPHSKRFMWDTILSSFQGSRGAILTTHAMEEADALCSRVGIMVNGKLKCIGSTQHLKNLYGAGYTLEIKMGSDHDPMAEKEQKIKQFVNDVFPLTTLEETFSDHLVFSIPQSSVRSLAHCFTEIENAKESLAIEEYSFSQTTLEQIFMKFAHVDDRE